jgi:hypothetical protein
MEVTEGWRFCYCRLVIELAYVLVLGWSLGLFYSVDSIPSPYWVLVPRLPSNLGLPLELSL